MKYMKRARIYKGTNVTFNPCGGKPIKNELLEALKAVVGLSGLGLAKPFQHERSEVETIQNAIALIDGIQANARLIAAAPMLLQLIKDIDAWYTANEMSMHPGSIGVTDEDVTIHDLLKQAIARATGGAE